MAKPYALISIGLAGGIRSESQPGRLIVASGAVQHDFDARPLTSKKGALPGLGVTTLHSDHVVTERLRIAALKVVERAQIVVTGVVLTGDQIVTSRDMRDRLLKDFPDQKEKAEPLLKTVKELQATAFVLRRRR